MKLPVFFIPSQKAMCPSVPLARPTVYVIPLSIPYNATRLVGEVFAGLGGISNAKCPACCAFTARAFFNNVQCVPRDEVVSTKTKGKHLFPLVLSSAACLCLFFRSGTTCRAVWLLARPAMSQRIHETTVFSGTVDLW